MLSHFCMVITWGHSDIPQFLRRSLVVESRFFAVSTIKYCIPHWIPIGIHLFPWFSNEVFPSNSHQTGHHQLVCFSNSELIVIHIVGHKPRCQRQLQDLIFRKFRKFTNQNWHMCSIWCIKVGHFACTRIRGPEHQEANGQSHTPARYPGHSHWPIRHLAIFLDLRSLTYPGFVGSLDLRWLRWMVVNYTVAFLLAPCSNPRLLLTPRFRLVVIHLGKLQKDHKPEFGDDFPLSTHHFVATPKLIEQFQSWKLNGNLW